MKASELQALADEFGKSIMAHGEVASKLVKLEVLKNEPAAFGHIRQMDIGMHMYQTGARALMDEVAKRTDEAVDSAVNQQAVKLGIVK